MKGIQRCGDTIELEAFAANVEEDISRHEEIKTLLVQKKAEPEATIHLPCHVIPFPKNDRFYSRKESLAYLESSLDISKHSACQRSITLAGLGGVGKTELALEFIWQHVKDYEVIVWIRADSLSKLEQGVSTFAKKLGVAKEKDCSDINRVVDIVKHWLETTGMSLVSIERLLSLSLIEICLQIQHG